MGHLKQQRGQFFTTNTTVQTVLGSLIQSPSGLLLEPSAGAGHLVKWAEESLAHEIEAVELDSGISSVASSTISHEDFFIFAQGKDSRYGVILGNPPYVAWRDVESSTRESAATVKAKYSDKTNLYHLFIDRCIDLLAPGGELVFIVPKEWLYATSASPLRKKMLASGSITHLVDCGEEKLFDDADVPALLIFRFVKGTTSVSVQFAPSLLHAKNGDYAVRQLANVGDRLLLLEETLRASISDWGLLKDSFRVRVGIVSGADKVFRLPEGSDIEPECVKHYLTTKGIEPFVDVNHISSWGSMPPKTAAYLAQYKQDLMSRRIAKFDETNWWKYGAIRNRNHMLTSGERLYAFAKTRSQTPFFQNSSAVLFGGGILGLFREPSGSVSAATAVQVLNHPRYRQVLEAMFLTTADKVSLQPATLEDAPFPKTETDAKSWLAIQS